MLCTAAHPTLRPSSILRPAQISPHGVSYLFLSSILHLNALKTGPFHEHSPLLHNIATTVPSWHKVQTGLAKMYSVEVLQKVPVVQHFWFGGVLGWRKAGSGEDLPSSGDALSEEDREAQAGEGSRSPDEPLDRVDNVNVVAPWKLPSLSGTALPPTGHGSGVQLPSMTTVSGPPSRGGGTTTNLPFSRQGVAPSTSYPGPAAPTPAPKPFLPPALFATRQRRSSLSREIRPEQAEQAETGAGHGVGMTQGLMRDTVQGAAASSSPFGVLSSATAGMGVGAAGQVETRVPWARDT